METNTEFKAKIRLALVRQRYNPFGGAERFIERALDALRQEGAEITLITRNWAQAPQVGFVQKICDPPYSRCLGGRAARDKSFAGCAELEMRSGRYDLVQSHERIPGCTIFRAGDGVHAAWLDHRAGGQSASAAWLTRHAPFHQYLMRQEAAMLAHPALKAVICNSQLVCAEMRRYYQVPAEKLVLIENGVDLDNFHPKLAEQWRKDQRIHLGIDLNAPVFLYVGSGFERKGVPQLLKAFAQIEDQAARLVIVGRDKKMALYERQAKKLGIESRVIFTGAQHDVRPFYGMADAFVLPTQYDPMPNAALEAMAAGLPLITTHTCGMASRVTLGVNGFVGDAKNVTQLSAHLHQMLAQLAVPADAQKMRVAARAAVADLSLENMAEKLIALYRRLLAC